MGNLKRKNNLGEEKSVVDLRGKKKKSRIEWKRKSGRGGKKRDREREREREREKKRDREQKDKIAKEIDFFDIKEDKRSALALIQNKNSMLDRSALEKTLFMINI